MEDKGVGERGRTDKQGRRREGSNRQNRGIGERGRTDKQGRRRDDKNRQTWA
jgi:hypothetical protein